MCHKKASPRSHLLSNRHQGFTRDILITGTRCERRLSHSQLVSNKAFALQNSPLQYSSIEMPSSRPRPAVRWTAAACSMMLLSMALLAAAHCATAARIMVQPLPCERYETHTGGSTCFDCMGKTRQMSAAVCAAPVAPLHALTRLVPVPRLFRLQCPDTSIRVACAAHAVGASRAFDLVALSTELSHRGHEVLLVSPRELSGKVDSMLVRQNSSGGGKTGTQHAVTSIALAADVTDLQAVSTLFAAVAWQLPVECSSDAKAAPVNSGVV